METNATKKEDRTIRFTPLNIKKEYDVNEKTDTAVLKWGVKNGYPRLIVTLSSVKTEAVDYSKLITAPFTYMDFFTFLEYMEEVINHDGKIQKKVECLNNKWSNGQRTDEIYVQATVYIGKGDDGVIFLAVIEDKKIKVKFDILPDISPYHRWYDENDNLIESKKELSLRRARSYYKILNLLMEEELKRDGVYSAAKITFNEMKRPSNITTSGDDVVTVTTPAVTSVPKVENTNTSTEINIDDLF